MEKKPQKVGLSKNYQVPLKLEYNYLQFDVLSTAAMIILSENYCKTYATAEPVTSNQLGRNFSTEECIPSNHSKRNNKSEESVKFIDSQRPGLHISTILRQIMFDVLYGVEFVILLTFGFSSDVKVVFHRTEYQVVVWTNYYSHCSFIEKLFCKSFLIFIQGSN